MSLLPSHPVDPNTNVQTGGPSNLPANGGGPWNGPQAGAGPRLPTHHGFDVWGPLQRRKYLVALICVTGAALGYLNFAKTPKSYASSTRLMITTNAPPTLVNGDMRLETATSIQRHANLIASELVLNDAVKKGHLKYSVGALKGMLTVNPSSDSEETLDLSCVGPDPEALPRILNQIIAAFTAQVDTDSQSAGQESKELIEQLESKLSRDKQAAEQRYAQLYLDLEITGADPNGNIVNPHNKKLFALMDRYDQTRQSINELSNRIKLLKASVESGNKVLFKVTALEAKKYLGLSPGEFSNAGADRQTMQLPGLRSTTDLKNELMTLNKQIRELQFERSEQGQVFGKGHNKIRAIDARIAFFRSQMQLLQTDLDKYNDELERLSEEAEAELAEMGEEETAVTEREFRDLEEKQWIVMYQIALTQERDRLSMRRDELRQDIESVSEDAKVLAGGVMELNLLQKEISQKQNAVRVILDQLSEINILASSFTMTKVRVLDQAAYGHKVAPSLLRCVALGTGFAFVIGLGLAVLIDLSDLSFRSPHEIAEYLHIPVVGRIPRIKIRKIKPIKGVRSLVAAHSPGSTASESFRDVRTSLFFQANVDDIKTILFTSPSPGDGKTTTACNLAISIANANKRVILVDADFRRPRVHQYFHEPMNPGLLDVLEGEANLSDAIQQAELQENLDLLTAGGRPKNPGEVVSSEEFRDLILTLREDYDFVLIDSPPVLPVSDPTSIASVVDGVYLVTRIRKGVKVTARRAKDTLDRVNTRFLGIIINGIDENPHYSEYGYQYGSYSYYGGRYGRYYEANYKDYREKKIAGQS